MKTMKKISSFVLAGVMICAALALTGCFGTGGSGNSGNSGITAGNNPLVGTWTLAAAYDENNQQYDLSDFDADIVKLVVTSDGNGTFYYFDDDPFTGTLSRDASQDSYYAVDGFTVEAYDLTGSDGSYWEFAYVEATDGASDPFIYLEVGAEGETESLYLAKN